MKKFIILFFVLAFALSGCSVLEKFGLKSNEEKTVKPGAIKIGEVPSEEVADEGEKVAVQSIKAILKTNMGDIKIDFFHTEAPRTVMNFANLAKADFYNGTKFHRVIEGFMVQGGDPNSKDADKSDDGGGGPGYAFEDEINPNTLDGLGEEDIKELEARGYVYNYNLPNSHNVRKGMVAMANSGPNTNGSQFFIVTAEEAPWLDGLHTVFGQVVEGMDIVNKINTVEVNENDYPIEDIILESVEILINEEDEEIKKLEIEKLRDEDNDDAEGVEAESVNNDEEQSEESDEVAGDEEGDVVEEDANLSGDEE